MEPIDNRGIATSVCAVITRQGWIRVGQDKHVTSDAAVDPQVNALAPLFDRMGRSGDVSSAEWASFAALTSPPRRHARSECIIHEGQNGGAISILCEGIAVSSRTLATGQQQNLAIFVPGDIVNYEEFVLRQASASVWALTPILVVNVTQSNLSIILEQAPSIARALWRDTAAGARIMQEWMVSMGRRSAYQRVAHFLCEVQTRFQVVGLATESECLFPLTQSELADTLGLSVVHINRVLQLLRREHLVHLSQSKLIVRDWAGLVRAGDFDANYLDLPRRA